MTPDQMEAESWKYTRVLMLIHLSSGNYALFGPDRKLITFVSEVDLLEAIKAYQPPAPEPSPHIDPGEYDL